MSESLFDFDSYRKYLENRFGPRTERRGLKSAFAKTLRCQPTFVSQVLAGRADLSLEQADLANLFLGHGKEESRFFFALVQRERAGTSTLRAHFTEQIEEMRAQRMVLSQRLEKVNTLKEADRARYYSAWYYAAIHIALTIPELQQAVAMSKYLGLSLSKTKSVLEFLEGIGLAQSKQGRWLTGTSRMRLGNDSHVITRHHANWRLQALESLDRETAEELHYSAVLSLSRKDAVRLKDKIFETLKDYLKIVEQSKEEELYCYSADLFSLRRG